MPTKKPNVRETDTIPPRPPRVRRLSEQLLQGPRGGPEDVHGGADKEGVLQDRAHHPPRQVPASESDRSHGSGDERAQHADQRHAANRLRHVRVAG